MMHLRRHVAVAWALTLIAGLPFPALTQNRNQVVARLDSIAGSTVAANRAIGLVAAVVRGNDTLLLKPYGRANVEWDVPMVADAMFETGSITKQFTAAAILQLRDAGKLSLDDEITKWLPDFNTRGNTVTLRHLLAHTSGIHDLTETPEFRSLVSNRAWPRDSAYALINRLPFDFQPGEAQMYSNSGFWLLALIAEKAGGVSYEDYLEKKIFEPLGMKRSMYCNYMENIPRRAHGYGVQWPLVARMPTNIHTWSYGAGAVCSTAGDMVTWMQALHGGKVLSPRSYAEMIAPATLGNGMTLRYGMGIGVGKDGRGRNALYHGGINSGFRSAIAYYPEQKLSVVVLTNTTGGVDPEDLVEALATELLPASPGPKPFTGDASPIIGKYAGRTSQGQTSVEVTQGPQGLMISGNGSPPRPLLWVEGWTFQFNQILLTFRRPGNDGPATELGFNPAKRVYFVLKRQ